MKNIAMTAAGVSVLAAGGSAFGQFGYVSQSRFVDAFASFSGGASDSDSATAPSFADFNANITAEVNANSDNRQAGVTGTMNSAFTTTSMTVSAESQAYSFSLDSGDLSGNTGHSVTFTLASPTEVRLFGDAFSDGGLEGEVRLRENGGATLFSVFVEEVDSQNFDQTFLLPAGTYDFNSYSLIETDTGSVFANTASVGYNATLEIIPAPGAGLFAAAGGLVALRRRRRA